MQTLESQHKQYILEHEQDIREGKWKEFFKSSKYPTGIGEPLYLSKIPFMEALGYIPGEVFYNCTEMTSITIPENVTSIGTGAFFNCTGLTSVNIPASVTSIGYDAFSECTGLTTVTFGENSKLTSIGDDAFYNCNSLTEITIPNRVTNIGKYAFELCSNLTAVTIPASVTIISDYAFNGCSSLTNITYEGTKEQWSQIYNKDSFINTYFTVNCIDGKLVRKRKK